ncbi:MAG TPA: FAD-binding oxidoreductase [Solirubrobacterales bacterium]|nr:FAD-binding oxidoreductase [Solirubrobacterales bacterium]
MPGEKHSIYWWETEPVVPGPPLEGTERADVCIVGGGYTGMWTAYFLKRADPALEVTIVERSWAGSGASGHNDGYAMTVLDMSLHHLVERHGAERAGAAHEAVARSVVEIGGFCDEHGVEADYDLCGFAGVGVNDGQMWRLERDLEAARRIGAEADFEYFEDQRAREVIGSPIVRGVLKERRGALINPQRLARGLARVIDEMGVRVHERSPATAISSGRVTTERGAVEAERIVVATNAYQHAFDQFKGRVVPIWSYAMVTEPLTDDQLGRVAWPGREGFEDKRNFITIGRLTADNRVVWGGRLAPYYRGNDMDIRHMRNDYVFDQLRGAWSQFFPMWSDVRFTHAYGGCVAITGTFLPYVGSLGGGVLYGYGYNGHGVAPSHTVGQTLADLVTGRDSELTNLVFVDQKESRLPGEPLRYLGTRLTTALLERQDRKMDRGGGGVGEMDPLILRVVNRLS